MTTPVRDDAAVAASSRPGVAGGDGVGRPGTSRRRRGGGARGSHASSSRGVAPAAPPLSAGAGLGLGLAVLWLSLLVLLPLAAVIATAAAGGWDGVVRVLTQPQTVAAIRLTLEQAALVTVVNAVMGTAIAWVLVRDRFPGRRVLDVVIDVPFALPTVVAGLVLLALYGPQSPLGVDIANTKVAVAFALAFVTLPFVVRTVQPVLETLDRSAEDAARSLGASGWTVFRRIVLPALAPAIAAGAALSFARGVAEYGSLVLISGNLAMRTEVASVRMLGYIEGGDMAAAAVVATFLLAISLAVTLGLGLFNRVGGRRG
ncbi:sulfate ABC transporter permease subunit CysT [Demequina silvatica]|uniref:sulfate ABC transporter permease subunit CysT n=1 Tax=Demequina silvatica TaxID=1638988 RepID=UPI0009E41846|nr:sulfate ABC transporter permease subunit CysT [Demequina silvatica]